MARTWSRLRRFMGTEGATRGGGHRMLTQLADCPEWLTGWVAKRSAVANQSGGGIRAGVPYGQRNDTATHLAGRDFAQGFTNGEVKERLRPFAESCDPPLDNREFENTVDSVERTDTRNHPERAVARAKREREQADDAISQL